ncbi:MAG: hypothetical protein NTW87_05255 [Planctomycetota bacterium]|nr:hypothetical protein [Planctomycetota bacterium]
MRKPSERFMRKPLRAKPRASHSERKQLADLANDLATRLHGDVAINEELNFRGYRPGPERPPG